MIVSIPQEILHWSLDDRHKFVTSMKDGNISVYNSRGIVIGCARAGKTTLVKKLRGARNLTTESTSGIEIHSHLFKLNADETAIIGKYFQCCAFDKSDILLNRYSFIK